MRAARQSTAVRVIVVLVGVYLVGFGLWAFLSPASFYDSIAVFPPYNQHFIHDLGALQVGLGAAMMLTQVWGDALLVVLAGNAVGATIHFAATSWITRWAGVPPPTSPSSAA